MAFNFVKKVLSGFQEYTSDSTAVSSELGEIPNSQLSSREAILSINNNGDSEKSADTTRNEPNAFPTHAPTPPSTDSQKKFHKTHQALAIDIISEEQERNKIRAHFNELFKPNELNRIFKLICADISRPPELLSMQQLHELILLHTSFVKPGGRRLETSLIMCHEQYKILSNAADNEYCDNLIQSKITFNNSFTKGLPSKVNVFNMIKPVSRDATENRPITENVYQIHIAPINEDKDVKSVQILSCIVNKLFLNVNCAIQLALVTKHATVNGEESNDYDQYNWQTFWPAGAYGSMMYSQPYIIDHNYVQQSSEFDTKKRWSNWMYFFSGNQLKTEMITRNNNNTYITGHDSGKDNKSSFITMPNNSAAVAVDDDIFNKETGNKIKNNHQKQDTKSKTFPLFSLLSGFENDRLWSMFVSRCNMSEIKGYGSLIMGKHFDERRLNDSVSFKNFENDTILNFHDMNINDSVIVERNITTLIIFKTLFHCNHFRTIISQNSEYEPLMMELNQTLKGPSNRPHYVISRHLWDWILSLTKFSIKRQDTSGINILLRPLGNSSISPPAIAEITGVVDLTCYYRMFTDG